MSALIWLVACGAVTEDNLAERSADAVCGFTRRCSSYAFYSEYDDLADCYDDLEDRYGDAIESADDLDCDYDQEKAEGCLDAFSATCANAAEDDDHFDDCDEIYDCGGLDWLIWF